MPENALVYEVWKKLVSQNNFRKDERKINWRREVKIHDDFGPIDLVGEANGNWVYAVEFKMKMKVKDYESDIQKLKDLKNNYDGLEAAFCALVDPWFGKEAESRRIRRMEELVHKGRIKEITEVKPFETKHDTNNPVSCWMKFWQVL